MMSKIMNITYNLRVTVKTNLFVELYSFGTSISEFVMLHDLPTGNLEIQRKLYLSRCIKTVLVKWYESCQKSKAFVPQQGVL